MQYVKLQIGCLLIILYIVVTYIKAATKQKIPCSRLFDALMFVAPWAVIFDGFTAWTVNHLDTVPDYINRPAHLLFFLFMDVTVMITTLYMYDELVGFSKRHKERTVILCIPGITAVLLTTAFIGQLEYRIGLTTNYSMGLSVYISFGSVVLHYGIILYLLITRHRFLPKEKILGTLSFIVIAGVILAVQIIFPEVLLTSIFPTILVLGIYVDFENPSMKKLTRYNEEMVEAFATFVENRDNNTGGHIKRTRTYVNLMLHKMRYDKHYQDIVNKDYLINVSNAAPLHDIGKVATPDAILQKPGKLTDEEYAIMKEHAARGGEIILNVFQNLDDPEFQKIAYEVARFHHEKYNGKGYPDGLVGEQIPLHARIMAIADVFDAVSQKRCYRDAMPLEECFAIIEKGAGSDFDPLLVGIFLEMRDKVTEVCKQNR